MKILLRIEALLLILAFFLQGCTIRFKATELELDTDTKTPSISKDMARNTTYKLYSISLFE